MRIEEYHFSLAGNWFLDQNRKSGISFLLIDHSEERVIYAFVLRDTVKYIGICDKYTTTLKIRMRRYKNLQGGKTNRRIAKNIKECLEDDIEVMIFALNPEDSHQYEDLTVDLVKGLENPLIEKFNPEWNK